jgi:hypothetical protein
MRSIAILVTMTFGCVPPQPSYYGPGGYATPPSAGDPASGYAETPRAITINGASPEPHQMQTLMQLEAAAGVRLPDGAYWYDATSGAFGAWGQAAAVLVGAGLDLGPPVPEIASQGTSSVVVNGRRLQPGEVEYLSALIGDRVQPGRYFIDAQGNAGLEGGPVLVNLVALVNARSQPANNGNRGNRGGGDVHLQSGFGSNRAWFDTQGSCKMFMDSKGNSISSGC